MLEIFSHVKMLHSRFENQSTYLFVKGLSYDYAIQGCQVNAYRTIRYGRRVRASSSSNISFKSLL